MKRLLIASTGPARSVQLDQSIEQAMQGLRAIHDHV